MNDEDLNDALRKQLLNVRKQEHQLIKDVAVIHLDLLEKSIIDIEKYIGEVEFVDYCDSVHTCIAYWTAIKDRVFIP